MSTGSARGKRGLTRFLRQQRSRGAPLLKRTLMRRDGTARCDEGGCVGGDYHRENRHLFLTMCYRYVF
jgi:hypothetical protein